MSELDSKLQKIFDGMPNAPVTVAVAPTGMAFSWCIKGRGFGEIFIGLAKDAEIDKETGCLQGKLHIDSESETKEFVKQIICQAIDEGELEM